MKIISTIFYTIFIAVVVGIAGLLLGTMLPIPGNIEVKIVKSGSMEPAIPTGSLVIVRPVAVYKKGDVITFGKDTKTDIPTTHRVISLNDDGTFTTKGDANEEEDQAPVLRKDVIGKVMFHVPGAGYVLDFARQPVGFTLLVAIPAGLVIMEELLTIFSETKKWARKRREDEDDDRGSPTLSDLSSHLKRVYAKRRAMDEIKVAMFVAPSMREFAWWRHKLGLDKDAYGTSTSLTIGLIFLSTMFAGHSGGTISYFQDIERSIGNVLTAGTWEDTTPLDTQSDLTGQAPEELTQFSSVIEEGAVLGESDENPAPEGLSEEPEEPSGGGGAPAEETVPEAPAAEEVTNEPETEAESQTGETTEETTEEPAEEPESQEAEPQAEPEIPAE